MEDSMTPRSPTATPFPPQMDLDPKIEKRILRKLDYTLIPILWCLFVVSFADRSNIGNARIQGMDDDLHLGGHRYNIAVMSFTIAYVLFGIPANIVVSLCGSSTLAAMMFLWGVCALCTGLVQTYAQLVVCRFLLGIFEAGFVPGCAYLIGSYYPRNEFLKRYTVFFSGAIFAGAFNGFLSYFLAQADGAANLAGWRWIFLVEGVITCLVAIPTFFLLPAFPKDTTLFKGEEKAVLLEMLRRDGTDQEKSSSLKDQVVDALFNWKIWLATIAYIGVEANAISITAFLPTILKGFGYVGTNAQVHTIPVYMTALVVTLICSYVSERLRQRYAFALFGTVLNIVGLCLLIGPTSLGAKYAGTFFLTTGSYVTMPILVVWNSINLPREGYTIVVSFAMSTAVGNCGAFIGSNVFLVNEAPKYPTGFGVGLGMTILSIVSMTALYTGLRIGNVRHKCEGRKQQNVLEQDTTGKSNEVCVQHIGEELVEEKEAVPRYQL